MKNILKRVFWVIRIIREKQLPRDFLNQLACRWKWPCFPSQRPGKPRTDEQHGVPKELVFR
jgi:hypothetical protein